MSYRRCIAKTRRGDRCTRKPRYADKLCLVHHRKKQGKPRINHPGPQNGSTVPSTNGHKEMNLRTVLEWIVNKATVADLEALETVIPAIGK